MINVMPQFVTADDFYNYWGINLNERMKPGTNVSNKTNIFLRSVEDRLMSWIDANTFRVYDWDYFKGKAEYLNDREKKIAEVRIDYWKKAILNQAMYVYRNSNIGLDSGYDPEKGVIASSVELQAIEICRPTIDLIKSAGLYNHVIKNVPRYTSFN